MRGLFYSVAMLLLLAAFVPIGHAGLDPDAEIPAAEDAQLVVMEADGCIYCRIFRRDILPTYEVSERRKTMAVRFLDINDLDASGIALDSPISILPTFVVIRNNREVGRIAGYVGPEDFFRAINYLMASPR